jgi:hypothetical protein
MSLPIKDRQIKGQASDAWRTGADELAEWAWRLLVNRVDVWGGYIPLYCRAELGKVTTRPRKKDRGKAYLTPVILRRHFAATVPELVVGLHSTSPDNTSRWGAVDIDAHGEGGNSPEVNLAAAMAWCAALTDRGFRPLLTTSDECGGLHLRFVLAEPVPTPRVFALLKDLTADYARHSLSAPPETFPKQESIPLGKYGNWLRLPGRHHTREHWSTVWDGCRWLAGADAVAYLLTFTGDRAALVPEVIPTTLEPRFAPRSPRHYGERGNLANRIAGYLRKLPNLGEGQGRDDVAFSFACWLVRDLAVSDDIALAWLERWDGGNHPPKGRARLAEILESAHKYGRQPVGCGRAPERDRHGHLIVSIRAKVGG